MSIVLTRFQKNITINRDFAESLAVELQSSHFFEGTILLVANEILLSPDYEFNYKDNNVVKFPGRYDLILVTDRFNSQGAKIDLTGPNGVAGRVGQPGCTAIEEFPCPPPLNNEGGPGETGMVGNRGFEGKNIKIYASKVENIEVISNGGAGGRGGRGGHGGDGAKLPVGGFQFRGGDGGRGGIGGDGAGAGKITVLFFSKSAGLNIIDHLTSRGGDGGGPGEGGDGGQRFGSSGLQGERFGNNGTPSQPEVIGKSWKEFWKNTIVELGIPTG